MEKTLLGSLTQDFGLKLNTRSLDTNIMRSPALVAIMSNPTLFFGADKLRDLTIELKARKYKVSLLIKLLTKVKKFFCKNYDRRAILAERAFKKIKHRNTLLKVACGYIELPENAAALEKNMEKLRKLRELHRSMSSRAQSS